MLDVVEEAHGHGASDQGRGYRRAAAGLQDIAGSARRGGAVQGAQKRLLERALGAELSEHLGYEKGDPAGRGSGNSRNGYSSKTVIGDDGAIEIAVPCDRQGSFELQIVAKGQTRLDGFDDRIVSLYATGCRSARSRPTCWSDTGSRFRLT